MVKVPTNKLSWQNGLLSLLPLTRGQIIDVPTTQSIKIVVCKLRDPDGEMTANNLVPQALLEAGGAPFRIPIFGVKQYQAIAIDIASRSIEFKLNLLTKQKIDGSVLVRFTYRVLDPSLVVTRDDVLAELRIESQRIVHNYVENLTHTGVYSRDIEMELARLDARHLGLYVERIIAPNPINWPENLIEDMRNVVKIESESSRKRDHTRVKIEEEKIKNDHILSELLRFNITDPETVLYVLAHYDKHDNVMQAVLEWRKQASQSTREERLEAIKLLNGMVEGGVIDGTQLEDLIKVTVGNATSKERPREDVPQVGRVRRHDRELGAGNENSRYLPPDRENQRTSSRRDTEGYSGVEQQRPYVYAGESNCQPANAYLVVLSQGGMRLQLCAGETRLGRRGSTNDIIISGDNVSRDHAVITQRGNFFSIYNLKEGIVTQVNGVLLPDGDEARLNDGDEVRIGEAVMQIRIQSAPQPHRGGKIDDTETRFS